MRNAQKRIDPRQGGPARLDNCVEGGTQRGRTLPHPPNGIPRREGSFLVFFQHSAKSSLIPSARQNGDRNEEQGPGITARTVGDRLRAGRSSSEGGSCLAEPKE
jgi:hypothetical protein